MVKAKPKASPKASVLSRVKNSGKVSILQIRKQFDKVSKIFTLEKNKKLFINTGKILVLLVILAIKNEFILEQMIQGYKQGIVKTTKDTKAVDKGKIIAFEFIQVIKKLDVLDKVDVLQLTFYLVTEDLPELIRSVNNLDDTKIGPEKIFSVIRELVESRIYKSLTRPIMNDLASPRNSNPIKSTSSKNRSRNTSVTSIDLNWL